MDGGVGGEDLGVSSVIARKLVSVMLCCNDDSGMDAGFVETIQFGDRDLVLSGPRRVCRFERNRVKIGRCWYPFAIRQTCVGNIYWDAVRMRIADALRLAKTLRAGRWTVEEQVIGGPFGAKA